VRQGEKLSFIISGAEADNDTAQALKLVVPLDYESNMIDPLAMFSTKEPHAVGDEWVASPHDMIKSLNADMGIQFDHQVSSGKIKFERVEKVNGIECCILTGSITIIPSSMGGLPESADLAGSTLKFGFTCPIPTDPGTAVPGGRFVTDMTVKASYEPPEGGTQTLELVGTSSREESAKPIK